MKDHRHTTGSSIHCRYPSGAWNGLALLLGDRLGRKQRRKIGWALFMTGAVITIPLAMIMLSGRH